MEILQYTFFQNAIIGAFLVSILCSFIGTYIVTRRLVFISGGITHASFGGIGIGVFMGINPVLSAMIFAIFSAFGVQWMSQKKDVRKDSAIALFWTFGMSIGIICCFLTPGFMPDLPSFLFGSILTIESADLILLFVLTAIVALLFTFLLRPIEYVAFDSTFARSQHLPVTTIEYMMMTLIAMTIVASLKMVGIVLAISLLTIPQMTANLFTYHYKRMIGLSIVLGWIDCILGLYISYLLNVPSGACIIFISIMVFVICKIIKTYHGYLIPLLLLPLIGSLASCSVQKNTAKSRWWHSFNARYNTYYNGSLAYIDASLEKENGNKDNFTEIIPLYTVSNKSSRELGKGNYEKAITKCEKAIHQHSIKKRPEWTKNRRKTAKDIEWLNRKEYNPFLWKAWLLMGRSQFYKGDFDGAAATFAYMSRLYATQPAIYGRARAWLAKCYIEQGWQYDAEDVIRNIQRDSIHWRAQKEWDYTYADYYIHIGDFKQAIPYLRKVIKHEMRRKQKAREWFLMGQLQAAIGNRDEAYKAFKHVIRLNPPYELEFNARISMSEVMAKGNAKQMIGKLKRMAASDKNKEYLDQVYYAMGNIYLNEKDTIHAIAAYENGNKKATRSGIEKGVLLLHLGDLYWGMEKYSDAQRCYGEAIGLLDKDRKDYQLLSDRSKILDELVPYTEAVHLQDSLQALAKMNEKDRNAAIDRVIEALKKKEKEEKNRLAEEESNRQQAQNGGNVNRNNTPSKNTSTTNNSTQKGAWYFYNPIAVSQGKTQFQRLWGKRENVDNWQRINKTVVSTQQEGVEEMTDEVRDSLANAAVVEDSLKQITDSAQNDPHKREYYLAQIPFTEEQIAASNKLLEDGLYHSGVIFKDKLDNLNLSEKALRRLEDNYATDFEHMDDVYYHLYLLYSRKDQSGQAEDYVQKLKEKFPESQWTALLTDPYFKENARFGIHIEDSLYTATYEAFKASRYSEAKANSRISADRFPTGNNRDKFLFIGGLSKLNDGDANGCIEDMKTIVEKYPDSRISEMAGMIVNGVNAGKRLHGGKFDLEDVWNRRSVILNDKDSTQQKKFSPDRNANFVFMLVYQPDSLNENQLLFEMAKYNFTHYLVRNFDINIEEQDGLHRMVFTGFRNYDEAWQYAHEATQQTAIARLIGKARTILISEQNLELLGTRFTYNDYEKYYLKHFAALKIRSNVTPLLTEPTEIVTEKEPEKTAAGDEEVQEENDDNSNVNNSLEIIEEETPKKEEESIEINESEKTNEPNNNEELIIDATKEATSKPEVSKKEEITKEEPAGKVSTKASQVQEAKKRPTKEETKKEPVKQEVVKKQEPQKQEIKKAEPLEEDEDGIYFYDETEGSNKQGNKNQKTADKRKENKAKDEKKKEKEDDKFDLEDEYFDFDGF